MKLTQGPMKSRAVIPSKIRNPTVLESIELEPGPMIEFINKLQMTQIG